MESRKIKNIFFSKTSISRGNPEFGIRKNKKNFFFDNSNSGVLVSKTSTRTAEKQCISALHCYNNTITPPDYVMECSGSWGNYEMPLQRLAGVGRLVGSQGRTPTMTEPVVRYQSDNNNGNNVN